MSKLDTIKLLMESIDKKKLELEKAPEPKPSAVGPSPITESSPSVSENVDDGVTTPSKSGFKSSSVFLRSIASKMGAKLPDDLDDVDVVPAITERRSSSSASSYFQSVRKGKPGAVLTEIPVTSSDGNGEADSGNGPMLDESVLTDSVIREDGTIDSDTRRSKSRSSLLFQRNVDVQEPRPHSEGP